METPQGRQLYRQRLKELGQVAYGTEEAVVRAGELAKQVEPAFVDERQRRSFYLSVSQLQDFLRSRRAFVLKQISDK